MTVVYWIIGFVFGFLFSFFSSGFAIEAQLKNNTDDSDRKNIWIFVYAVIFCISVLSVVTYFFNESLILTTAKTSFFFYAFILFSSSIILIVTIIRIIINLFRGKYRMENIKHRGLILRIIAYIALTGVLIYILKVLNHPLALKLIELSKNYYPNISAPSIWIIASCLAIGFNLVVFITILRTTLYKAKEHFILDVYNGLSTKNWILYVIGCVIVFSITAYPQPEIQITCSYVLTVCLSIYIIGAIVYIFYFLFYTLKLIFNKGKVDFLDGGDPFFYTYAFIFPLLILYLLYLFDQPIVIKTISIFKNIIQ